MGEQNEKKHENKETVCEFFGIKITTKKPHLVDILTKDVGEILNRDVHVFKREKPEPETVPENGFADLDIEPYDDDPS
ncbi:MAG: hypothetical protein KAX16_05315 [Actinomycetia bacterium]|nr:hypothetical protein [Actinomycetes bacterium]